MRRLASILALFPALALAQTPLTTADDWQAAVQTAAPSSWFVFAEGTYTTTGTALTVTSGWTRIQGAGPGQSYLTQGHGTDRGVVHLTGPEIVLDGFTIYGGSSTNYAGGGVMGTGGQTVTNCHVVSNSAPAAGGTHLVNIHNSIVAHNFAWRYLPDGQGGGGVVLGASNVARQCVVSNNSTLYDGGGLAGRWTTYEALVDDCDVVNNSARNGGGLYYVTATNCRVWRNAATNATPSSAGGGGGREVIFVDCSVVSNVTTKNGGGVYRSPGSRGTTFAHNSAGLTGGGGYNLYGTNLIVRDNVAAGTGGGIIYGLAASSVIERNVSGSVGGGGGGAHSSTLIYSLIVSNRATATTGVGGGGGVYGCTVESCAFVDNYTPQARGLDSRDSSLVNCTILNTNAAAPVVQQSSSPSRPVANTLIVHATATNILDQNSAVWTNVAANYFTNSADGLFLLDDPPYRLPPDSPLIDAGNGDFVSHPFDLWGRDRTYMGGDPDIGATEWTGTDLPPDNGAARKRRIIGLLFGKDN